MTGQTRAGRRARRVRGGRLAASRVSSKASKRASPSRIMTRSATSSRMARAPYGGLPEKFLAAQVSDGASRSQPHGSADGERSTRGADFEHRLVASHAGRSNIRSPRPISPSRSAHGGWLSPRSRRPHRAPLGLRDLGRGERHGTEVIALAELHAAQAEDVVGGGRVEM